MIEVIAFVSVRVNARLTICYACGLEKIVLNLVRSKVLLMMNFCVMRVVIGYVKNMVRNVSGMVVVSAYLM